MENAVYPWSEQEGINLLLAGETNVNRPRPEEAFVNVAATLRSADVLFGHMESPCSPNQDPARPPDIPHKPGWVFSRPDIVNAFKGAGYKAVSCASNVMYGEVPVRSTIEALDSVGIRHCGIGLDKARAHKPAIVKSGGLTFGFLSYTSVFWPFGHAAGESSPGTATIRAETSYRPSPRLIEMPGTPPVTISVCDTDELEYMRRDIRELKAGCDIVTLSCHWGVSGMSETADYQREIAHAAIDEGADIIIGHHPHIPQGIEVYKGRPVFYSLGNFAFDWELMRGKNLIGALARCIIRGGRLTRVSLIPSLRDVKTNDTSLVLPGEGGGKEIAEKFISLSGVFGTRVSVRDNEIVVELD